MSLKHVLLKKNIHKGHGGRSSCQRKHSCHGNIYFVFFCGGCVSIFRCTCNSKLQRMCQEGQLVQTNLREWAEDEEWNGVKERKINEINPFSPSPSLSPSLKCKCGLLVSYLCPKSASRKISWPSAAPYIGLSSYTHTHTHTHTESTSSRQRQIAAHSRMSM